MSYKRILHLSLQYISDLQLKVYSEKYFEFYNIDLKNFPPYVKTFNFFTTSYIS